MTDELKTSVRVLGDRVGEFEALCYLRRRKPYQLAADLVLDGINREMADPETAAAVAQIAEILQSKRAENEALAAGRQHGAFRVYEGGTR